MLEFKKVQKVVSKIHQAKCDRCGEWIDVQDGELLDGMQFNHSFSWHNKNWPCGDVAATVCDECIEQIFHFGQFSKDQC